MKTQVQCYAGYRGEEEPRAFYLGERRVDVMAVVERWLSPDHRCFRVQTYDGGVYVLCHDEARNEWEVM
jgi:hypothetical protein